MIISLTQKLNIIKSKHKDFISYNIGADNKLESFVLNNNFRRYANKYEHFMLLDVFKRHNILEPKENYSLNQILKTLNIN